MSWVVAPDRGWWRARCVAGLEGLDDDHAAATGGARLRERRRLDIIPTVGIVGFGLRRQGSMRHGKQLAGQGDVAGPAAVGKLAVVADPMEALRQQVHVEASDELVCR